MTIYLYSINIINTMTENSQIFKHSGLNDFFSRNAVFTIEEVISYVFLLENSTTAAKVGFFLEGHKDALMVEGKYLEKLKELRPRKPHYLSRNIRKDCRLVKNWNLMVPVEILSKSWEEEQ